MGDSLRNKGVFIAGPKKKVNPWVVIRPDHKAEMIFLGGGYLRVRGYVDQPLYEWFYVFWSCGVNIAKYGFKNKL